MLLLSVVLPFLISTADFDKDGYIDWSDFIIFSQQFGQQTPMPYAGAYELTRAVYSDKHITQELSFHHGTILIYNGNIVIDVTFIKDNIINRLFTGAEIHQIIGRSKEQITYRNLGFWFIFNRIKDKGEETNQPLRKVIQWIKNP